MTRYLWVSYGGTARTVLAIILLAAAVGLAYAGTRFRRTVRIPRPGRALTVVSAMVKLSRPAFFCLALMLLVFAVWALAGFGYPSAPLPIAMNDVSKILAFVTALSLFFPEWFGRWWRSQPDRGIEQAPGGSRHAASAV